ncbi:MAG TPA: hypothetical protein VIC26_13720 [Marinagarivorans sp.]
MRYENPVNYLMHAFKNKAQWQLGDYFCALWLDAHREATQNALASGLSASHQAPILVPVPSHYQKCALRGYVPSQLLAGHLAAATGLTVVNALTACRALPAQKSLKRKQRLQNLAGAYAARHAIADQPVILVDDVVTSCATAIAASQSLLDAGASSVDVWAIARTPLF